MRPLRRMLDQTVLHRIETNVVQMRRHIVLAKAGSSRIVCSQYRRCQIPVSRLDRTPGGREVVVCSLKTPPP